MPIGVFSENPHYLAFRDRPVVLVGSGEHYGAVLNADFDYVAYLDELQACGLNLTRTFSGVYCEAPGDHGITNNTLAPAAGRLLCPFARACTPHPAPPGGGAPAGPDSYAGGGPRFDLSRWDDAYFRRLKDFIAQADRRGIVVEFVLFCPIYHPTQWQLSPLNARNNVNGVGDLPANELYTLSHPPMLHVQQAMVRRIVAELRDAENLYYEICNEPYFGGVTLDWQHAIADTLVDAERAWPRRHLIAQNIANGRAKVEDPHPAVSIFNFHYATPPDTVALNWDLRKPLADDETGFKGQDDFTYRREAWEFLLAGGAVFSHLDYSFSVEHPRGDYRYPPKQPGGGSAALRRQLAILRRFVESFDFPRLAPDPAVLRAGAPADGAVRILSEPGRAYAVYVHGGKRADLALALPAGPYRAEWINTRSGAVDDVKDLDHPGGDAHLATPAYEGDVALRLRRHG